MSSPQDPAAPRPSERWVSPWSLDEELPRSAKPRPAPQPEPISTPSPRLAPSPATPPVKAPEQTSTSPSTSPTPRAATAPTPQAISARPMIEHPPTPRSAPLAEPKPALEAKQTPTPAPQRRATALDAPLSTAAQDPRQRLSWLILPTLIVFAFTVLAWTYLRDDPLPPYDGDLAMPAVDVANPAPPAINRLRTLLDSIKPIGPSPRNASTPWTWDTPSLSLVANANAPAFGNLRDLIADTDWYPQQQAWFAEDLGSRPDAWAQLGFIEGIASAYHQRLAQEPAALRASLDLAAFARRLQAITAWPTYYPRSVELHQHACEATAALLRTTTLDARTLTPWQLEWENNTPQDTQLAEAFRGFYEFERKLIVGPRAGDPWDDLTARVMQQQPGRLFFKPNRTLGLFARSFLEMKEQALRPAYLRSTQIAQRIGPPEHPTGNAYSPNYVGLAYANKRIWLYVNLMERHSLERARHQVVLTLFALRRWVADHSSPPATLAELIPHYLNRLPIDPFSGEPLCYDAKKGLLYSVGTDLLDDHGHPSEVPLEDPNEPTVRTR